MKIGMLFMTGVVVAAVATAVLLPGRPTAKVIKATGDASSNLLGTAIKG